MSRTAKIDRETKETNISIELNLDGSGQHHLETPVPFFNHMLSAVARHGFFDLTVKATGDTEIDDHHTVEDTAICLGNALCSALGDKRGIGRYGFVLPMDESEAKVSIDLSGRGRFVFNGDFQRERVGELSTEMVEHFFRSLSDALGAAIHIDVSGQNAHHMVEACFKSVGRALRQAIHLEGTDLPSTKGTLS